MPARKVGIREFREKLATFLLDSGEPVAIVVIDQTPVSGYRRRTWSPADPGRLMGLRSVSLCPITNFIHL
jgi:hypothetical protein